MLMWIGAVKLILLILDSNFRFNESLGGYIFNFKTTGLLAGTYELSVRVAGDPELHAVTFQVR